MITPIATGPWARGEELLVRFTCGAYRCNAGESMSRRRTTLYTGDVVRVETDEMTDGVVHNHLFVVRKGVRYLVYRGDVIPRPTDAQVAHMTVELAVTQNALELSRQQIDQLKKELGR